MTEYSSYNFIDTEMQRQDKTYVATSKLPVKMLILLTMQK